jgi:DNA-directed RNA polymerase sigma subunit (sigma70/sigma32)
MSRDLGKPRAHTKFHGDWRYVPADTWRLDLEAQPQSPEDDIIAHLDGTQSKGDKADIWVFLSNALSDKRAVTIIYSYLWLGESMESIGADLGLTRQRVWQLYKAACKELAQTLTPSEFKQMFIS